MNYLNVLIGKLKEVLFSVVPITAIVLVLHLTVTPLEVPVLLRFLIGVFFIILGLAIFLFGVDIGITPIGNLMGSSLVRSNKLWIVIGVGMLVGFFVAVAEPDLHVVADQVDFVTDGEVSKVSILVVASLGTAVMVALGLWRMLYAVPLYKVLTAVYLVILVLGLFTSPEFLAVAFDASAAITGVLIVPFILALAIGITSPMKDSEESETDSFGLVWLAGLGVVISLLSMGIISGVAELSGNIDPSVTGSSAVFTPFLLRVPVAAKEVFAALVPIVVTFLIFQYVSFKLSRRAFSKVIKGLIYTFIGLVFFLVGVNAGFMDVGRLAGYAIAALENKSIIVFVGFVLGLVVVLAEPAVYVLTQQIEEVTGGYVKRSIVLVALSLGVGGAVGLSMLRIVVPGIKLWHFLAPGYVIAIALSYVVPKLFVGMGFDSGAVASGPMTATFILAFAQGAAGAIEGANVLIDGFGVIAMVALMPILTVEALGLVFAAKSKKEGVRVYDVQPDSAGV